MADILRGSQLATLVAKVGGYRKAEAAIKRVKGCAPTFSAIHKAVTSNTGTDFTVQCYIDCLIEAIHTPDERH